MARRRADLLAPLADLENVVLVAGLGYIAYLAVTGKLTNFFCPGGGGLCSLIPMQTSSTTLPPVGTAVTNATVPSIPTGDLVVMTSQGPVTFGPNGQVPGTGQSVNDLRSSGYSDSQIASMVQSYYSNPGAYTADAGPGPAGGAGGSW